MTCTRTVVPIAVGAAPMWAVFVVVAFLSTACVEILEPDRARTGVVEHAELGAGGNILLTDVRGDRYKSLMLGLPDNLEILVEGSGGVFEAGSRTDLQPGTRVRFERTDDVMLLISPPGFWATKIWVLRD